MAVIGIALEADQLVLTKNRDFKWAFENLDEVGEPTDYPAGALYFEFSNGQRWDFVIDGDTASLKVEHTAVNLVPARTKWQLVFLAAGEPAGGDPIARGTVTVQE
ncbi:hypothetical protein KIV66_gp03 [Mycobacterium phage MyraDee]|uniref:LtfC/p132/Gp6 beta-sandwich domain-containing protein n=1 Tax=Mycobacterium phage MyraDee TaxID=2024303 RepID=A0A222YXV8_9CAUD|nr:hypothetical protein KIV66_gp03 [Mycobacterium phage MyraDee]ASR77111.1 hypothetical protein SEA_MYRADEE_3 [Mycobacterium phage MyraDee]